HVVWGEPGNEWKATLPATHTPWEASATGAIVIDRSVPSDAGTWMFE
ncbi:MAG: hypothetical protein ACI9K2_006611, partial [Myxococcota bacterium]